MAPVNNVVGDSVEYSTAYLAEDVSARILGISGALCLLSVVIVCLRTYVRAFINKCFGWEDICMLITAMMGLAIWICFFGEAQHVVGRHIATVTLDEYEKFLIWSFAHFEFNMLAVMVAKVSVSLLLIRIDNRPFYRKVLYCLTGLVVLYSLGSASVLFWACTPITANWDLSEAATARCIDDETWIGIFITQSVLNMITDIVLASLPIPLIFKLRTNMRTKVGLAIVLSLGVIAVICGAIKTAYQFEFFNDEDKYFEDKYFLWAAIELYAGIIAASVPTLKPWISMVSSKIRGMYIGSHSHEKPLDNPRCDNDVRRMSHGKQGCKWTGLDLTIERRIDEFEETMAVVSSPNGTRQESAMSGSNDSITIEGFNATPRFFPPGAVDSVMASAWSADSVTNTNASGRREEEDEGRAIEVFVTTRVTTIAERMEPEFPQDASTQTPNRRSSQVSIQEISEDVPEPSSRWRIEDFFRRHQWIPHVVAGNKIIETQKSDTSSLQSEDREK